MSFPWLYVCVMFFVFGYHLNSIRTWPDFWWCMADVVFWPLVGLLKLIEKVKE